MRSTVAVSVLSLALLVSASAAVDFTVSGTDPAGDAAAETAWTIQAPPDEIVKADILAVKTQPIDQNVVVTLTLGAPYNGEAALTVNFDINGDYKMDYALTKLSKRPELFRFSPQGKAADFVTLTATGVGTKEVSIKVPVSEFKGDLTSFNVQAKAAYFRGRGTDWAPGSSADAKGWFGAGGAPAAETAPAATLAPAPKAEATPSPSATEPPKAAVTRTVHMLAIQPTGAAEVGKEPFPATPVSGGGFAVTPPSDPKNPASKWEVSAYSWSPAVVVVYQGEQVVLKVTGINGKEHVGSIEGHVPKFTVKRGETTEVSFKADKPGIFKIACEAHGPPMEAYLVVLPRA